MSWTRTALVLAALHLPAAATAAEPDSVPEAASRPAIQAVRTDEAIVVDGRLDDDAWARAVPVTGFTQIEPYEGEPASERTAARILFDDEALYVGVRLWDSGPISSRLGRRDMPIDGDTDWLGVMLDSDHDRRTAFGFDVNPHGVRRDLIKTITRDDTSWDPVWQVATSIDEQGWTAELRIPFSQLRFSGAARQTWGIQLERVIARNGEYATSTFIPRSAQGGVPEYGDLTGLEGIGAGKRLELMPYALTRADGGSAGEPAYDGSFGLDLQYRLTSELTLSATMNPDFGQVELDPAVVNLSAFETFFPERRPFFVKDAGVFSFGSEAVGPGSTASNLFYSRRIGRRPQISAPGAESPDATRILSAAKLAGKTAGGWSIGAMQASTRPERATPAGAAEPVLVEPFTHYGAARVSRDMNEGGSAVGGMVTTVHRHLESDRAAARLPSAAYAGGIDFRHAWSSRSWSLSGFATGSHVRGDRSAMGILQSGPARYFGRPDADHLEPDPEATTLSGYAAQVQLRRQGGRNWRGDVGLFAVSPGYEVNDLGYTPRGDLRGGNAQVSYQESTPGAVLRSYRLLAQGVYAENFAGDAIDNGVMVGGMWRFQNFWTAVVNASHGFAGLDDRLTRGGPIAARPARNKVAVQLDSDPRRDVSGTVTLVHEGDAAGGRESVAKLGLTARPSPRWNVSAGPVLRRIRSDAQYVTTVTDATAIRTYGHRYVFAEMDQTTLALETRLNLTFSPNLTLEAFAQPFLSAVRFGDPKELAAPRTRDFVAYAGEAEVPDPSFNLRSLRGNAVLRWEWRPGSTMYLAWQQQREDFAPGLGDFDLPRDRGALFRTRPANLVMLKVSHWLNF